MYGWRARIGLILPAINTTMEPEFNAMKPKDVSVHATRLLLRTGLDRRAEALKTMARGTEGAAELLAAAKVNIIAYGCTTGSLAGGIGWDEELIRRIERLTGIPATTTSTAVLQAFKALGVSKVAIATPYVEELNEMERLFLEAHGIKVLNIRGLGGPDSNRRPEITYKLACEVDTPEAEAVFISCTGFKSITIIEKVERQLQKHVFSSNTATMWGVLRRLGIKDEIKGYGKLLRMFR